STYFDVQVGARFDVAYSRAGTQTRSFAVLGVQGLAPYFWEIDASLFVSMKGDVSAEFEAEYDLPITQRLIGQPRIGTSVAIQDVTDWGDVSCVNYVGVRFRLRYEIKREFAPFLVVSGNRQLG